MASKTLTAVLQPRRDSDANFRIGNPVLAEGEMAISLDKGGQFKVGDGVNNWMDLSYNTATPTTHTHTASEVGLGNLTNDKQVKGLSSGTTAGHVVTWGADGYTVADSGYTIAKSVPSNAVFTDTNNRKSFYGTCDTAAATAKKVVTLSDNAGWELKAGTIVGVKFTNTNTASSCTLNVNGTGDKSIWYNNAAYTGNSNTVCGVAGRINYYMYDGSTYWVWMNMGTLDGNTDTYTSAYSSTAAGTAAKVAGCTNYSLLDKSWLHVTIANANTSATALTLNVNGNGAKSIYINGAASSTTNYTLPAGTYLVYYASNIYYFRTDGKLTANITGDAGTVNGKTVGINVPSNAVFTDTKNTAGSTDTSSKIFLVGATSQAANPQTYSDNEVYVTSGVLTTKSVQVGGTAATIQYNSTNKCIDFIFT